MFPTTIWTTIDRAGRADAAALERFAERYRPAVLQFIRGRGFAPDVADDLCQEVFVRVIRGAVLAKADPERGRFRSLLLRVTTRVIQDRLRRPVREVSVEVAPPVTDPAFDRAWAWNITARALDQMREEGSVYLEVLEAHLAGRKQDRNRLWNARRRLADLVRREIAMTCTSDDEAADELAYLARFLRPRTTGRREEPADSVRHPGDGDEERAS